MRSLLASARDSRFVRITAAVILGGVLTAGTVLAVTNTVSGTVIDRVRVVRSTDATQTHSQAWVGIPGASVVITIPSATRGLILARYSAESVCYTTSANVNGNWCSVRIMLYSASAGTTVEMDPAAGVDFAFDSTNNGNDKSSSWEGHSMDRSAGPLPAGIYRVFAQYRTTNSTVVIRVDDWSLTVEKAQG
jgi:hypothetical protein